MRWDALRAVGLLLTGNVALFWVSYHPSALRTSLALVDRELLDFLDRIAPYVLSLWVAYGVWRVWVDRKRRRDLVVEPGHRRGTWVVTGLLSTMTAMLAIVAGYAGLKGGALWAVVFLWIPRMLLVATLVCAVVAMVEEAGRVRRREGAT